MNEWKTLKEVAKELKISKDLVKYHRKNVSEGNLKIQDGIYYISSKGVEEIRGRLKNWRNYNAGFEEAVLERLRMIEVKQELIYSFLLDGRTNRK